MFCNGFWTGAAVAPPWLYKAKIEFLSSEGKASDRLDEKVNLFLKISKEENIYTRSCDIGGPCFTAFQFLHKHRIVEINDENTLNKNPYELLSYWAKMTIDFNLACKGFFEAEGLPLNIIYKYCDLNKEGKVWWFHFTLIFLLLF